MHCYPRYPGLGLVVLGLVFLAAGAWHAFGGGCHRAEFEKHVAEVCVKAAGQVQK